LQTDAAVPYQTIKVDFRDPVCHIHFNRPNDNHTINDQLVAELHDALARCEQRSSVIVLAGSAQTFCMGADFQELVATQRRQAYAGAPAVDSATDSAVDSAIDAATDSATRPQRRSAAALYHLWLRLATGPFITVAHVEGRANAGGIGFVAACDLALAAETAQFGLSELLFGLYPACVMPFLVKRVGLQRAHYLTLTAQAIPARQAAEWGLVDAVDSHSDRLVQRHLQRLTRLRPAAVQSYKAYVRQLAPQLQALQDAAVSANAEMFANPRNRQAITDYVERGVLPWEDP
jgi:polyketide biosynthesis enoyl-CoA hydratase PksH